MKKKMITAILTAIMLLNATACSDGKNPSKEIDMTKYITTKNFRTFIDVPPDLSEKSMTEYKALGFNGYILTEDIASFTDNKGVITQGYKDAINRITDLDLEVYIRNQYNDPDYFHNEDDVTLRPGYSPYKLPKRNITNELDGFKGITGYYMADEPNYKKLSTFQKLIDWHNAYGNKTFFHMNLYPSYASSPTFDGHTYSEYVDQYINAVISKVNSGKSLCLDNYPLVKGIDGNVIRQSYLSDLMITATATKKYNDTANITSKADYGVCIQSFYDAGLRDITSAADITFQLAMGMAMGATVYEYFMYGTGGGMYGIMENGEKRIYDYVKEADDKMLDFYKVINCFEWQGAATCPAEAEKDRANADAFSAVEDYVLTDLGNLKSIKSRLDTVVGMFKHPDGENGYMIVNYSEPSKNSSNYVDLEFKDATQLIVYRDAKPTVVALTKGKTQLRLASGEGVFVIAL